MPLEQKMQHKARGDETSGSALVETTALRIISLSTMTPNESVNQDAAAEATITRKIKTGLVTYLAEKKVTTPMLAAVMPTTKIEAEPISGKISEGFRPEGLIGGGDQQVGGRQQAERHAADFRPEETWCSSGIAVVQLDVPGVCSCGIPSRRTMARIPPILDGMLLFFLT